jgi:hypothetical protein
MICSGETRREEGQRKSEANGRESAHLGRHELGGSTEGRSRLAEPHVLLAQSVIGDLDVTVEGEENVVELEIAEKVQARSAAVSRK